MEETLNCVFSLVHLTHHNTTDVLKNFIKLFFFFPLVTRINLYISGHTSFQVSSRSLRDEDPSFQSHLRLYYLGSISKGRDALLTVIATEVAVAIHVWVMDADDAVMYGKQARHNRQHWTWTIN